MENINFTNFIQVVELLENAKYLGKGHEGICYRVGNKTYKLYNDIYCDMVNKVKCKEELLKFRDVVVENIYFVRALFFYDLNVVGSITDYANGKHCGKIYLHRRGLDNLILALSRLKKTVFELSKRGIYIDDEFFLPNILYDGVDFKLIDTGSWYYSSDVFDIQSDEVLTIYRKNMEKVMKELFCNITCKYDGVDSFIYTFLCETNSPYKDYLMDTDLMIDPDETVIGIRREISEYVGHEIVNFSCCRNELLRMRKRR